ncbi:MAG: HD domain-containing protein [Ignisphaera sp.]
MESIRDIYYMLLDSYEFRYNKVIEYTVPEKIIFVLPCIGEISVDVPLSKLLFLPMFRRLKDVKQLAHTHIYLPGAMHTRYEHSLGVMAISLKVLEKLRKSLKEKANIDIDDCDSIVLGIAALLHDIGHTSWGHALDGLAGIILDYFTEFLERKLFLSDIGKLDIAIALYLLEHNEQLTWFFKDVVNEITKKCGKILELEHLRKIVWLTISEEWNLDNYLDNIGNNWARKIKLFQTILGSPRGVGGVNTDRLDWIIRDSHHTYIKMHTPNIPNIVDDLEYVNSIVEKIIMKGDDISDLVLVDVYDNNIPIVTLKNDISNRISNLRKKLYTHVYEGFERTLIDSLLTRIVFSALKVLYHAGKKLSGPSIALKVITSYLLQPDHDLVNFTRKILDITRYTNLADYSIVNPAEQQFIMNSLNLMKYVDDIDILIHSIRNQKQIDLYSMKSGLKLNQYIASIPFFDVGIVCISCGNYFELIERVLKNMAGYIYAESKYLVSIFNNLILAPRINLFKALKLENIEFTLYQKVSEIYRDIKDDVNFYVLPNYYAFRKLYDIYWQERKKLNNVDDLIKIVKEQGFEDYPVLIILNELRKNTFNQIKLEKLMPESFDIAIDQLLIHILDRIAQPSS